MKKIIKKILKYLIWIILSVVFLLFAFLFSLNLYPVQKIIKSKASSYLSETIGVDIAIGELRLKHFNRIVIGELFIPDLENDTLLYAGLIDVEFDLPKIFQYKICLKHILLRNIHSNIALSDTEIYNFDFILSAFSSNKSTEDDSSSIEVIIDNIQLENIRIAYNDWFNEMFLNLKLKRFDTEFDFFDVTNQKFFIDYLNIEGLVADYKNLKIVSHQATTTVSNSEIVESPKFDVRLNELNLSDINLLYLDTASGICTSIKFKEMLILLNNIDILNETIELQSFNLSDVDGYFVQTQVPKLDSVFVEDSIITENEKTNNWKFVLDELLISRFNFHYANQNNDTVKNGFDHNNINLRDVELDVRNILYSSHTSHAQLRKIILKEKAGFELENISANISMDSSCIKIDDLIVQTPYSKINNNLILKYKDFNVDNFFDWHINLNMYSEIGMMDVKYFVPEISNFISIEGLNKPLIIDCKLNGLLDDIDIQNLNLRLSENTYFLSSGNIKNTSSPDSILFNYDINNVSIKKSELETFLINTLSLGIDIPENIILKSKINGNITSFTGNVEFESDWGDFNVNAKLNNKVVNNKEYSIQLNVDSLLIGKFLKNPLLSHLNMDISANGMGMDVFSNNANLHISGDLKSIGFNDYEYKNVLFDAKLIDKIISISSTIQDENINMSIDFVSSIYNLDNIKSNVIIENLDLYKLNLHEDTLILKANINANIQSIDIDSLVGQLSVDGLNITHNTNQYKLSDIVIDAKCNNTKTITLDSEFVNLKLKGNYNLSDLYSNVNNTFLYYFNKDTLNSNSFISDTYFKLNVEIKNSNIFKILVPELEIIDKINLDVDVDYNSASHFIDVQIASIGFDYKGFDVNNFNAGAESKNDTIHYFLKIDGLDNKNVKLHNTELFGNIANNNILLSLLIDDEMGVERYFLSSNILAYPNGNYTININSDNLTLDYKQWNINSSNLIYLSDVGYNVSNFVVKRNNAEIKIESLNENINAPITAEFQNFYLHTITNILQNDDLNIDARLDGNVYYNNSIDNPLLRSQLLFTNLSNNFDTIGNVKIDIRNNSNNHIIADVGVYGGKNEVVVNAKYDIIDSTITAGLTLAKLNMQTIEPFAQNSFSQSNGFLSGYVNIFGNIYNPQFFGELKFNDVELYIDELGAKYHSMNNKIIFTNERIDINNFKIQDVNNEAFVIDGNIILNQISDMTLDLKLKTDNFTYVNISAVDNDLYYGKLLVKSDISIKGEVENLTVNGNVKINKDTDFTLVVPQSNLEIVEREGIVEFMEFDLDTIISLDTVPKLINSKIKGIDVAVNIEIDPNALFTIIVDKNTGDYLTLKGNAKLSVLIDKSGKVSLTGLYEFNSGTYEMSMNLIKRKFNITPGSFIRWTGEPDQAEFNIIALYRTNSVPLDLVQNQLGSVSQDVKNQYLQRIPFDTKLIMSGELLNPQIDFDIVSARSDAKVSQDVLNTVDAKLAQLRLQPTELNKQVFALLLLNRFIGENPLAQTNSASASLTVRESAGRIMSKQLNQFMNEVVTAIDINFDFNSYEDYTSGSLENRTNLNLDLSKQFLNNRLQITVGSSVEIEGSQQNEQNALNLAGDVSVDYLLSADGRYRLRVYRDNNQRVALMGEIVETGVAFIINLEYDKFREFLKKEK